VAQFVKGKSGNPGGRPIMPPELREAAKAKTVEALDVLAAVMRDDKAPPAARVSAAVAILDRGWGRPAQSVQVDDKRRSVDEMSTDELMAVLKRAGAQADDLDDVEPVGSA
jgi:hypothetical protein